MGCFCFFCCVFSLLVVWACFCFPGVCLIVSVCFSWIVVCFSGYWFRLFLIVSDFVIVLDCCCWFRLFCCFGLFLFSRAVFIVCLLFAWIVDVLSGLFYFPNLFFDCLMFLYCYYMFGLCLFCWDFRFSALRCCLLDCFCFSGSVFVCLLTCFWVVVCFCLACVRFGSDCLFFWIVFVFCALCLFFSDFFCLMCLFFLLFLFVWNVCFLDCVFVCFCLLDWFFPLGCFCFVGLFSCWIVLFLGLFLFSLDCSLLDRSCFRDWFSDCFCFRGDRFFIFVRWSSFADYFKSFALFLFSRLCLSYVFFCCSVIIVWVVFVSLDCCLVVF